MQAFHFQFQPFNTNFEELFRRLNVIGNTKKKKPEFLSVFRLIDWESFGNSVIVFCLSIRLSVCVSDFLWSFFVRLSVSVSLFLSVFVSDCFSQSFYLPLCLAFSLFLSFCMLSVCTVFHFIIFLRIHPDNSSETLVSGAYITEIFRFRFIFGHRQPIMFEVSIICILKKIHFRSILLQFGLNTSDF